MKMAHSPFPAAPMTLAKAAGFSLFGWTFRRYWRMAPPALRCPLPSSPPTAGLPPFSFITFKHFVHEPANWLLCSRLYSCTSKRPGRDMLTEIKTLLIAAGLGYCFPLKTCGPPQGAARGKRYAEVCDRYLFRLAPDSRSSVPGFCSERADLAGSQRQV